MPENLRPPEEQNSNNQDRMEEEALKLLQSGKLKEAEKIYRDLISSKQVSTIIYNNLAAICGMQGRHAEVPGIIREALKLDPDNAEAHNNLGNALRRQRDLKAAIAAYRRALEVNPNYAEAHNNLGTVLRMQGDPDAAIAAYRQATRLKPDYAQAYYNLGNTLRQQGELEDAIRAYQQALELRPQHSDTQNNLGNAFRDKGDLTAAIAAYRSALECNAENIDAYNNLGNALRQTGDLDAAISAYHRVLAHRCDDPAVHNNLGTAFQEQGKLTRAIAAYHQALELEPNDPKVLNNLGLAHHETGQPDAAIAALSQALTLQPDYPEALNNLGITLQSQGDLDAAVAAYQKALELKPDYPQALNNLGVVLQELGELENAIAAYKQALNLEPQFREAAFNLSMALLLTGDYRTGWELYENRLALKSGPATLCARPRSRRWDGRPLTGDDRLVIIAEQGLGDTLQFMRYVRHLEQQGMTVSFCAPSKLHSLIRLSGIATDPLKPEQAEEIREGFWIPLLSLPRHLGIAPEHPGDPEPYIATHPDLQTQWKSQLEQEVRPIIGINWQGNPEHEKTTSKGRSLPLEAFAPLVERTDVTLLSLQKGFGSEQLESCSFRDRFVSCQSQIDQTWNFPETAAILANCDLVITSDTSVAHLAGGMGKRTWLLLKKIPEWRWGLNGEQTGWYPSMRLFRQRESGNWTEVLERVAMQLEQEFNRPSPPLQPSSGTAPETQHPLPTILAPISLGELIDKISILRIKTRHLTGPALENVSRELQALEALQDRLNLTVDPQLSQQLQAINADLWRIEDQIRAKEQQQEFDDEFINLARSVYRQNDQRAAVKRHINLRYGSALVEEKSYQND